MWNAPVAETAHGELTKTRKITKTTTGYVIFYVIFVILEIFVRRRRPCQTDAITWISTRQSLGRRATCTVARAGAGAEKYVA